MSRSTEHRPASAPSNQELFEMVASWLRVNYPGENGETLLIVLHGRAAPIRLPLPLLSATLATNGTPTFEPTVFQLAILDALAGKALRVDALAAAVKDRPKLYRDPGGLKELERQDLIRHSKRAGYFRPDAPPEGMDEE